MCMQEKESCSYVQLQISQHNFCSMRFLATCRCPGILFAERVAVKIRQTRKYSEVPRKSTIGRTWQLVFIWHRNVLPQILCKWKSSRHQLWHQQKLAAICGATSRRRAKNKNLVPSCVPQYQEAALKYPIHQSVTARGITISRRATPQKRMWRVIRIGPFAHSLGSSIYVWSTCIGKHSQRK